jgi:hypothetical protein
MPGFKVTINGTNCVIEYNGTERRLGFFATHEVDATSAQQAEELVIEAIGGLQELREKLVNATDNPPLMQLESIGEVSEVNATTVIELAWYAEDDDEDL